MSVTITNQTKITCPHCDSKGVMKYGTYKGVQPTGGKPLFGLWMDEEGTDDYVSHE